MEKDISNRIAATRYLMVIGIVILHTPPYQSLPELANTPFDLIKAFFSHGVFRTTVPVLTAISGYLLFSSSLPSRPYTLIARKSKAILLPLILWNLPVALAIFVSQKYQLLSHTFSQQLYPIDFMAWVNALTGLFELPANYPLNFLRDLFVLLMLAPVFRLLLHYVPYIGLGLISLVYWYNLEGELILRNSMLISFYIGALAASTKWQLTALDKYAWPLLISFLACCLAIAVFDIENREFLRLLAPFMVWPAMSLLINTTAGELLVKFSPVSFLTFLAHGPLLLLFWLVFNKLPLTEPHIVFWFIAPVLVIMVCILTATTLRVSLPSFNKILLGGR